ncbi:peptidase C15, pyroglutamyl peptidase I-like protein [Trichocladium antarcticum]|uniref:Peptidase C15, pyroglutamyl peptidase I-like protein n=1 Tax=Trichocladium antarcticum TaxID=1450529 RepID=A0AAN6UFY0_9PEZI|nr:peptidase C15, pyroglutamyl peptidase I-like protein [Trichocladium antarcticum]
MGSVGADDTSHFTVLITGFGPFKKDYPINPSWEIARSLPEWLPPLRAKSTTATPNPGPGPDPTPSNPPIPPVRLVVHPEPIRVSYAVVRDLVPKLWRGTAGGPPPPHQPADGGEGGSVRARPPRIDLTIHIGMAGPRLFYSIERRGHRDGYGMEDVDGVLLGDEARRGREGPGWVWEGVPAELETELDLEDVLGRWRGSSPNNMDLRISEDAGHYLCDFIYFSSLAHLYKAGAKRKVLFLHVPSDASQHSIALGRELLLQLVRSVVASEMARDGDLKAAEAS